MSSSWHWFIAVFTIINIIACVWLIVWSSRQGDDDKGAMETLDHTWDGDLAERNNPLPRWWLFLFVGTIIWGLGYLAWYPGLGAYDGMGDWSQISQYEQERKQIDSVYQEKFARLASMEYPELSQHAEAMEIAGRLYGSNCATCHGADARGAIGFPNLTDDAWLYGSSPQTIETSITNGRRGVMPGWQAALGEDGVAQTVAYVQSLAGLPHDADLAEQGKSRYGMFCVACHGAEGKGMQPLGAPNLTDDAWLYGNTSEAITMTIAEGRAGVMPAQKDLLSAEEIKLLAAYVVSLGQDQTARNAN